MRWLALSLVSLGFSVPALAAKPQRVVACVLDAPGSTEAAKPIFDQFFRSLETDLGWSAERIQGLFTTKARRCRRELRRSGTTLALLSPALYLRWRGKLSLRTLAVARVSGSASTHYHVVVRKGGAAGLAEIAAEGLFTNHGDDRRYLSRVVLEGKLGAKVKVRRTRRPLRALRAVHQGQARATLIDDLELAKLKLLPFGDELQVIHSSPALPNPLLVRVGRRGGEDATVLADRLQRFCDGKGRDLCEALRFSGFEAPDTALLERISSQYAR